MPDTKTLTLSREARRILFEWYLVLIAQDKALLEGEDKQLSDRILNFLNN